MNAPKVLSGWLPRRLRCIRSECYDRAAYVEAGRSGKFTNTYLMAGDALEQAARRIEDLERQLGVRAVHE